MLRCYHIVAIPIKIVVNNFGDHNPDGMMYVLKENEEIVKERVKCNPFMPEELVQPLTIRANAGDLIEILFENKLDFATSMHIQRADYDVQTSDGSFVGCNENSTAPPCPPGGTQVYKWHVAGEGIHFFSDLGNTLSSELGSNVQGLFGALLVQPKGSWWTDPKTGKEINSGMYADIHNPLLPSFREYAWYFHDEMEVDNILGETPIDPHFNQPSSTHLISYRSEPERNRMKLLHEGVVCPDCAGEEVHHDSWTFGDPATPILRSYVGDPLKIRVIHGGVKETHVFHYHVHQWLFEQRDQDSEVVDSQAISPQNSYTISPLYGAGSLQEAFGDVIIHCHLYPHFMDGMWGMHRIFNTLQDGSQCYPNGVPIEPLQPLPGRPLPPKATPEYPGFPNFIPGIVGCKAPRPPLGIVSGRGEREPTEIEINQFAANAAPGALFVNPCIEGVTPIREYHIVAIQMPVIYNRNGWHDPEARLYVLAEDEEDVLLGRKEPEPLVIRANAGECVHITFTNKLPETLGGNTFQLINRTYEASTHIHFVKFDPLCSDGANVGWNYDTGVLSGQTIRYQWYADVELKGTFFHDHLFANAHQQHGLFGGIIIEAKGSEYLDNKTGKEINSGIQALITNPLIPDYRELALFVHDFALLFDKDGCPLNPPPFPSSHEDPGVMGVNYKNEPLQFRLKAPECDPAFVFSSYVHGDPVTPILETYNGDCVRIRLFQGAQEESHSFNLHRQRWRRERGDLDSELTQQQHLGISESFTAEFAIEGKGDFDMLYHYGGIDDIWLGNWGLLRTFESEVPFLFPLPDRACPPERLTPLPYVTCDLPPKALTPGQSVPKDVPIKSYEVVALQTDLVYNKEGDHDPFGIIFILARDEEAVRKGIINPEPLILRANVGDYVEITLHNKLINKFHHGDIHGYPEVPVEAPFPPSLRISLHPQLVAYDVRGSDGATVGFNPDQTICPGESITYRWYVDQDVGACNLWDMADLRNHRHHGAFGMLITEPKGSVYVDPKTREETDKGNQVVISNPLLGEFREFAIVMHDGARLVDKKGNVIIDPEPIGVVLEEEMEDFEDQGSRGFNYRAERFLHRLRENPDISKVFSSKVHGDPATPIFYAYPGDQITIRFIFPADKPRAHTFVLHGHRWSQSVDDVNSEITSTRGQSTVGTQETFQLRYGAGSYFNTPGDYLYRSGNIRWDIELGVWGIMRVLDEIDPCLAPLKQVEGEVCDGE
ncbi:multicopper oxidase [Alkalihalobacillus alcalophilus ATCC 27647 = CGMCC 1.3604]|uniref:Multicopper oxidase n=1 Tax=Alkalihalobacillus alcalophilus ATCC 27647 = CGMCC 1.3604 TaxID=1218173 RepID=A0A094WFM8_ALKAL|nr:multicopper oxidase domain-containing protein [Alkalihalobacillus alcalophilus]KGA96589.1 multicopper oxidase [Alkalihalobacillus alcalophilus ATCC 27647 = CGMCC 1.3604]THG89344.1 multicopper oxidase [Alkalihalobacillus alcalophilus ATCC 27647 = CGMCC 1.3604]